MRTCCLLLLLPILFLAGCSRTDDEESFILKHYRVVNLMDEPATLQFFKVHDSNLPYEHLYKDSLIVIPPRDTVSLGSETFDLPYGMTSENAVFDVFDSAAITFDNWPARTFVIDLHDETISRPHDNILRRYAYRQSTPIKQGNTYISDNLFVIRI